MAIESERFLELAACYLEDDFTPAEEEELHHRLHLNPQGVSLLKTHLILEGDLKTIFSPKEVSQKFVRSMRERLRSQEQMPILRRLRPRTVNTKSAPGNTSIARRMMKQTFETRSARISGMPAISASWSFAGQAVRLMA